MQSWQRLPADPASRCRSRPASTSTLATQSRSQCGVTISSSPDPALRPATETASVSSRVTAIEYQGYFVKVMLDAGSKENFVVYVSERKFFNNPVKVGDAVLAIWPVEVARLLR